MGRLPLLIILGVIIVGIAVAVGIIMFQDNAVDQNRSAVIADLTTLSAKAQQYYAKPTTLGGGGNSFVGRTSDAAAFNTLCHPPLFPRLADPAHGRSSKVRIFPGTGEPLICLCIESMLSSFSIFRHHTKDKKCHYA